MSDVDPLVPDLAGLVVDLTSFLDSCDDDTLDPHDAVRALDGVAAVLDLLPQEQRVRILQVMGDLALVEVDPARRAFVEAFGDAFGLLDD